MPNITSIPAPRVPFIDERTGLISREWYRFMLNLFTLTGSGASDISVTDLAVVPNQVDPFTIVGSAVEQSQLASIAAQYSQFLDIVGVAPVVPPQASPPDDLTIIAPTVYPQDDLAPRYELGTMAAQNAASVGITGGTVAASTVQVLTAAGYLSSDGSTGYTGTVTTASLVGKTITIKDGIITNFA